MSTITEMQINKTDDINNNMYNDLFYSKINEMVYKAFDGLSNKNILEITESYKIYNKKGFDGCVYFIKDNIRNIIKIGMTRNLKKRINELKNAYDFCGLNSNLKMVACFLTTRENLVYAERYFHKLFKEYLDYREWYNISEEKLIQIIDGLQNEKGIHYCNINNIIYFSYNIGAEYLKFKNFECDYSFVYNNLDIRNKRRCKYLSNEKILHDIMLHNICSDYKFGCIIFSYKNNKIQIELKTSYCENIDKIKIFTYDSISNYFVKNPRNEFIINNINAENVNGLC